MFIKKVHVILVRLPQSIDICQFNFEEKKISFVCVDTPTKLIHIFFVY